MPSRRETLAFMLVLAGLVGFFLGDSFRGGRILSPADVLFASASYRELGGPGYEPLNRLLIDPALQFEPWLAFNRAMLRAGRLPLWNDAAGCGAPHLANGQSAPFDPFHAIAYLGPLPESHALMAAARLWFAGLGMFLLASRWGRGIWGRWFSGLAFPFCGFLVVWLLFPVTPSAIWLPWLFWATDKALDRPDGRNLGLLGLATGGAFLGGHIQTSAYVLLAAGLFVLYRLGHRSLAPPSRTRAAMAWGVGILMGLSLAAVSIAPLWHYLGKSPVWADREQERPSALSLSRPRVLDAACVAIPYAYGSQTREHPNLARALGVHNLNESAGGFAGLATLFWLAPQAWLARRRDPRVWFLVALGLAGFLVAFEFPPAINIFRALPILNVTDHRRLVLWVAFALVSLGGVGLDNLAERWPAVWGRTYIALGVGCAGILLLIAWGIRQSEPFLTVRAEAHYRNAAASEAGDSAEYLERAHGQVRKTLTVIPRVLGLAAAEILALSGLALALRRSLLGERTVKATLLLLTLAELMAFGRGLNPSITRADHLAVPAVAARLRSEIGRDARVVGVGAEFPPNLAMRNGLLDARNYDSIELTVALDWLEPLYAPSPRGRSSRRTVTWAGVLEARERLREAGVRAVVSAAPPPSAPEIRAERVGSVWIGWLDAEPLVSAESEGAIPRSRLDNGLVELTIDSGGPNRAIVRQTWDPGWKAEVDGIPTPVDAYRGTFLAVPVGPGKHDVVLLYDPPEIRDSIRASVVSGALLLLLISGIGSLPHAVFRAKGLESSKFSG